jgi:hypothetical protein
MVYCDIVEAEFHFDLQPALSPKQHKETANPVQNLKRFSPHLIDQALYLFDFHKRLC